MKQSRPYGTAVAQLSSAWKHLARRRTKGDNAARKLLRGMRSDLIMPFMHETLYLDYMPGVVASLNRPHNIFKLWKRKRRTQ